jgi:hexosaminidase
VSDPLATRPQTIPALREWAPGGTAFSYGSSTRVVVRAADETALRASAETFAGDLGALLGTAPPAVAVGNAGAGDIALALGDGDAQLGEQGYRMVVDGRITISARTVTGAFFGTRSVLQLLRQSRTIPGGTARDWPQYPERGVLIDGIPRKYKLDWWRNLIRELSYLKMNELTVITVDRLAPREEEMAELGRVGGLYHVNVTPLFALPAHAPHALIERPEFHLDPDGPPPVIEAYDFTKAGALDFAQELIERHIDNFPGRYWHTSGDEYLKFPFPTSPTWDDYPQLRRFARERTGNPNADGPDAYKWFLNWVNAIVKGRQRPRTLRVWNDHLLHSPAVQLDRDIVIEYWIPPRNGPYFTPQEFADAGHKILNASETTLYHDNGWRLIDPRGVYENFVVTNFDRGTQVTGAAVRNVLGARLQAWMYLSVDKPNESNEELAANLSAPMRSLAQVVWGSPKPSPGYTGFRSLINIVGTAPGRVYTGGQIADQPAALPDVVGRLTYVVRRMDGSIEHRWQANPGGAWAPDVGVLATGAVGRPAYARDTSERLCMAYRTSDGRLVFRQQRTPGGGWAAPVDLAKGVAADAKLLVDGRNRLSWFARGANGALMHGVQQSALGPWSQPITLATGIDGEPVVALDAKGKSTYFVRTLTGALLHGWQNAPGGDWVEKAEIDGGIAGDPAVKLDAVRKLTYFVRTVDGTLRHGWQDSPGNGPWHTTVLDRGIAGDPAIELDVAGRLTYFVRTQAATLRHGWQNSAAGAWNAAGATLTTDVSGDPVVLRDGQGRLAYFIRRGDNALVHAHQVVPGGAFQAPPLFLLNVISNAPSVVVDVNGKLTYFVSTPYGYLLHGWQRIPGVDDWMRATLHGTVP